MSLMDTAQKIAAAALKVERIEYGPWKGSMRSISADLVPDAYLAGGANMNYLPRLGGWKRRGGRAVQFDVVGGSAVGLLPSSWLVGSATTFNGKGRQLEEFSGEFTDDGIPSLIALVTKEDNTTAANLDDGRFSNVYVRDQENSLNYTIGAEFESGYPSVATTQSLRFIPLWYESGDGGITRGANEFSRRFFASGSRRFETVDGWTYLPNRYGTPARWNNMTAAASAGSNILPSGDNNPPAPTWGRHTGSNGDPSGNPNYYAHINADDDFTLYLVRDDDTAGTFDINCDLSATIPTTATGLRLTIKAREMFGNSANTVALTVYVYDNVGNQWASRQFQASEFTTAWTEYTDDMTLTGSVDATNVNSVTLSAATGGNGANPITYLAVSYVKINELSFGGTGGPNRLIPSGPFPPTHGGTLAAGDEIETTEAFYRPITGNEVVNNWQNQALATTNLYQSIDETSADDTDYVASQADAIVDDYYQFTIEPFAAAPNPDDTVRIYYRQKKLTNGQFRIEVYSGATLITSRGVSVLQTNYSDQSFDLTPDEISDVADWEDIRIRFAVTIAGSINTGVVVSYFAIGHTRGESQFEGGWRGKDKFAWAVLYQFKDGSVWAPTIPRAANDILTSGFNIFQVNSSAPSAGYESLNYTNLPIPPKDVENLVLVRTPKIDTQTDSALQINVRDLRFVATIPAGVTSYEDFYADDDSLNLQAVLDGIIRLDDHIMTPRARYVFAGNTRVAHAYGGASPVAITIAPVGISSAYDLNLADTSDTLYDSGMYMRITRSNAGVQVLELVKTAVANKQQITLTDLTLNQLVDTINATTITSAGGMWRAQLCGDTDGETNAQTALCPHYRTINSCVVSGQTITLSTGGLSKVAVGAWIDCTGNGTGASQPYVTEIVSDTSLKFAGTITAGTKTLNFYFELGDLPTNGEEQGWQRVLGNSLPGFLYFNKTHLDTLTFNKSMIWETVAAPGSVKSAPNAWSGLEAYRHTPPLDAGISMGGRACDNGFVVPFSKKRAVIRDTPDGRKLIITNEASGCCAWQSLAEANRAVALFAPEGWIVQDLDSEILISEATYVQHPTATGDYDYEAPLCIAATAQDNDNAYLIGRVMRNKLYVTYRESGDTYPGTQTGYDFSSGADNSGLAAWRRPDGSMWGWDTEHRCASGASSSRAHTAMCEGRTSSGSSLYTWIDGITGSTGGGRIDKFETGTQDQTTDFTSQAPVPWKQFGDAFISVQEAIILHSTPSGATVALRLHRSFSDQTFDLTPSTSSSLVVSRDLKLFTTPARAPTAAVYLEWRQTAGSAAELRGILLKAKRLPAYRPAA